MLEALHALHFIRPQWFWALLPLGLLLAWLWRRRLRAGSWRQVVSPALLPYVLSGESGRRSPWPFIGAAVAALLAVTALAGPAWERIKQPVYRQQSALVVLLDLSSSMDATDVYPSRLQRAKQKLIDILHARKEGQTGLIAYAARPFVVSPLTDDSHTIISQLDSLTTDLMPAQGSRLDRALGEAAKLLHQDGMAHGEVLVITDGVDGMPAGKLDEAVAALRGEGYRLSLLGVGTRDGAPIPQAGGGFVKDASGSIVIPKLHPAAIEAVARAGGGIARFLSPDDSDTNALVAEFARHAPRDLSKQVNGLRADQWQEAGPWLLLPLLALVLLGFRRGYLVLALFLVLPLPRPAEAMDWQHLWQRSDQLGQQAFDAGDSAQAAKLFHDPAWRAAAHYRAGDYAAALKDLKGVDGPQAAYNRGNALAKLNRLPDAIKAYDEALKQDPKLADAKHNRDLLQKLLDKQKKQGQQKGQQGKPNQGDRNKGQQGQQQGSKNQQGQQQNGKQAQQGDTQQGQQNESAGQKQGSQQQGDKNKQADAAKQQNGQKGAGKKQAEAASPQDKGKQGDTSRQAQAAQEGQPDKAHKPVPSEKLARKSEQEQATEQWLRRIPDDPGGLWRRKFLYQYRNKYQSQGDEEHPW